MYMKEITSSIAVGLYKDGQQIKFVEHKAATCDQ
jgi:hypothetical protein